MLIGTSCLVRYPSICRVSAIPTDASRFLSIHSSDSMRFESFAEVAWADVYGVWTIETSVV